MKPIQPVAAFVLLVVMVSAGSSPGAQAPGRGADALIPGPPETVSLDQPSNPYSAYAAFTRVLDAAGVRYGIEAPLWNAAAPPIDLARQRDSVLLLGGRRLGDALDLIVKAAPQFRWTDRDGVIVVRSTAGGAGILDRPISVFSVTDASPRRALEAVIAAIDPARPPSLGIVGFGRPGAGAGSRPERTGRNVTLSMNAATLESILTAIARENGELSWTVRYDRAPAAPDATTITFVELGVEVTALSSHAQQTQNPPGVPGPLPANRLTIASMSTMLLNFGERSGLRISFEEVAPRPGESPASAPQVTGLPLLELPDQPAAALARIVALDSRYEWSEKGGRYLVRPKPGVPGRLGVLDEPITGFRATNEPAGTVIERALAPIGSVRTPPAVTAAQRAGAPMPASSQVTAMLQPIDVDVASPATVRDVLNAIADVTGWSWTMRPSFSPGRPTTISFQWRGRSTPLVARGGTVGPPFPSAGSWTSSVGVIANADLAPPAAPTRAPAVTMPAALDRALPQTTLNISPGTDAFRQIGARVQVPMGLEDVPRARRDDPRYMMRPQPPLVVGPSQFSDALYVLLERLSEFELLPSEGIVNVAPATLARSTDYVMNRPIDAFAVTNAGVFRAVGELRRRLDPQFVPADWTGPGQGTLNTPVTLSLTNTTPRAILNEIARRHGRLTWMSSFDGAEAAIANWTLTLVPLDNAGPAIALSARGGALAVTSPPVTGLTMTPGTRLVMLDLPVTSAGVRGMLQQAQRATGVSIGFAGVVPVGVTVRPTGGEYYNLSGLSMDEMLEKLRALSADFVTSSENGVVHVRVREAPPELTRYLDQRIAKFDHRFENLRDAMNAVATIGVIPPSTVGRGLGPGGGGAGARGAPPPGPPGVAAPGRGVVGGIPSPNPVSPAMESLNQQLQKTIVISMTDATVRQILDEIARQFGSMVWMVDHRLSPGGSGLSLMFGSEGWSIGTSVR